MARISTILVLAILVGCTALSGCQTVESGWYRYHEYLLRQYPKEIVDALERRTVLDLKQQSGKILTAEERAEFDRLNSMLLAYRDSHPAFKNDLLFARNVQLGQITIGMEAEQVRVIWGPPVRVNRDTFSASVHEQWVYEMPDRYAYFTDGRLTSYSEKGN